MTTAVSFDQFCPVAVSLDALGSRWGLLLLRDLLWAGPQSRAGLDERNPSITGQQLDETLEHLQRHRLVTRLDEPKARYDLTERGRGIADVINALFNFGLPLLDDVVVNDWMLAYAIADCSRRKRMELMEVEERSIIRLIVDEADELVELSPGLMRTVDGHEPHATVTTSGPCLAALLGGSRSVDDLIEAGDVTVSGDPAAAQRLLDLLPADH